MSGESSAVLSASEENIILTFFEVLDRWCDLRESITTLKSLLMCGSPSRPVEKLRSKAAFNMTLIVRMLLDEG